MPDTMKRRELPMNGYFYGFSRTGCSPVDKVLSEVACAGSAYHSTEFWNDTREDGGCCREDIQAAADNAAVAFNLIIEALDRIWPFFEGEHAHDHPDSVFVRDLMERLDKIECGSPKKYSTKEVMEKFDSLIASLRGDTQ